MELGQWVTGSPGHHFDPAWDPSFSGFRKNAENEKRTNAWRAVGRVLYVANYTLVGFNRWPFSDWRRVLAWAYEFTMQWLQHRIVGLIFVCKRVGGTINELTFLTACCSRGRLHAGSPLSFGRSRIQLVWKLYDLSLCQYRRSYIFTNEDHFSGFVSVQRGAILKGRIACTECKDAVCCCRCSVVCLCVRVCLLGL